VNSAHRLNQARPWPGRPALGEAAGLALLAGLLAGLVACSPREGAGPEPAAAAASAPAGASGPATGASAAAFAAAAASAPPVSVTLVRVQPRDFTLALEASGTVTALSSVEVKPQVSAQVLAVHVKEAKPSARPACCASARS